jgi:anti-anti-sigma regulatory factor/anti-sigma regulatory factor (Ser/Thr protein kinase)
MTDALICRHEREFPVSVLHVSGPLSLATVPTLREAAHKAMTDQPDLVLIDVNALSVVDDITLTAFAVLAGRGVEMGVEVMLVGVTPLLRAQLDRMGIGRRVPIFGAAADARAAYARRPGPQRMELKLAPAPGATTAARQLVDRACVRWQAAHLTDVAALIVTELVANAVRHARTEMRVSLALRQHHLHIAVRDRSPLPLRRVVADDELESGRGLLIVEGLATSWGSLKTAEGKVVWATLRLHRKR